MSKLIRSLGVGLSLSVLFASVSLAGPGRTDGDPDRPMRANPGSPRVVADSARVSMQRTSYDMVNAEETVAREDWRVLVKVYLKLLRIFAL